MISTQDMKKLEDTCGIPKHILMENAGKGAAKVIIEKYNLSKETKKNILIICYHGNNGGDGIVVANELSKYAIVDVLFIGDEKKFKYEAKLAFEKLEKNYSVQILRDLENFAEYDILIDALLGTGTIGDLNNLIGKYVELINSSKSPKISLDVPTGIDPNTGKELEISVKSDLIIAFHDIKKGLEKFKKIIKIVDIGIK